MGAATAEAIRRCREITWHYADLDLNARREIECRIRDTARRKETISYSALVEGITFHLPNVQASDVELGVPDWSDLHRAILGDFLGRIACNTYEKAGFLASVVAVSKATGEPSEGFRDLAKRLGLVPSARPDDPAYLSFWAEQLRKAHEWYAANA